MSKMMYSKFETPIHIDGIDVNELLRDHLLSNLKWYSAILGSHYFVWLDIVSTVLSEEL